MIVSLVCHRHGYQQGDQKPPMKSTNPEKVREAPPKRGDIYQSVQNLGAGTNPLAQ